MSVDWVVSCLGWLCCWFIVGYCLVVCWLFVGFNWFSLFVLACLLGFAGLLPDWFDLLDLLVCFCCLGLCWFLVLLTLVCFVVGYFLWLNLGLLKCWCWFASLMLPVCCAVAFDLFGLFIDFFGWLSLIWLEFVCIRIGGCWLIYGFVSLLALLYCFSCWFDLCWVFCVVDWIDCLYFAFSFIIVLFLSLSLLYVTIRC